MEKNKIFLLTTVLTTAVFGGVYLWTKFRDKGPDSSPQEKEEDSVDFMEELLNYGGGIDRTIYQVIDISKIPEDILLYLSFLKSNHRENDVISKKISFWSYENIVSTIDSITPVEKGEYVFILGVDLKKTEELGKKCYIIYDTIQDALSLATIREETNDLELLSSFCVPETDHPHLKVLLSL